MFCRYCGKTLNNVMSCPNCGKDNGSLEGGNGFWDILKPSDEEESRKSQKEVVNVKRQKSEDKADLIKEKKKRRQLGKALIAACLLCFALIGTVVFLGLHIKSTSDSLEQLNSKVDTLLKEYSQTSEDLSADKESVSEPKEAENASKVSTQISSDLPTDVLLPLEKSFINVYSPFY